MTEWVEVAVEILRYTDDHFPGFVESALVDAEGRRHVFVEKVPVVSLESLRATSKYPRPGAIRCEIRAEWTDAAGRALADIDTDRPDGVESTDGRSRFVVHAALLRRETGV